MGNNGRKTPSHKPPKPALPVGPWVCVEGHDVAENAVQRGIDNRPIGLCWPCRRASAVAPEVQAQREAKRKFSSRLVPVMLKADWRKPPPPVKPAEPMAMFTEAEAPKGFLDGGRVIVERETARSGRARR